MHYRLVHYPFFYIPGIYGSLDMMYFTSTMADPRTVDRNFAGAVYKIDASGCTIPDIKSDRQKIRFCKTYRRVHCVFVAEIDSTLHRLPISNTGVLTVPEIKFQTIFEDGETSDYI